MRAPIRLGLQLPNFNFPGVSEEQLFEKLSDIATITRHVTKRGDKVYIDYLQNGAGRLLVAPFSVRPLPGAPVSMPLRWSEVNDKLGTVMRRAYREVAERAEQEKLPTIDYRAKEPNARLVDKAGLMT